jgi:hypothetical protein
MKRQPGDEAVKDRDRLPGNRGKSGSLAAESPRAAAIKPEEKKMNDQIKEDLHLLLIYLTGWEEDKKNSPGQKVFRAWNGYRFEVLQKLEQQRLIRQFPGAKSLFLTVEGKQKAEQLKQKYL